MSEHPTERDSSDQAARILQQMDPNWRYQTADLRALAPDLNVEAIRELMHELWIAHEVERFGDSGWRRTNHSQSDQPRYAESLRVGAIKPEDLFDHDSFAGWFK